MFEPEIFQFDPLSIQTVLLNLGVSALLSILLKIHFKYFGTTLVGRAELGRILPFLTMIVCLIISVVKSSLALSLGLVGALSIVRFRTPIKEPEELVYLFMAIAIGLGLGADQTLLTVIATFFILVVVSILRWKFFHAQSKTLFLSASWEGGELTPESFSQLILKKSDCCDIRRLQVERGSSQASFLVSYDDSESLFRSIEQLQEQYPDVRFSVVDQSRIPGV